jgi:hypothetical protein
VESPRRTACGGLCRMGRPARRRAPPLRPALAQAPAAGTRRRAGCTTARCRGAARGPACFSRPRRPLPPCTAPAFAVAAPKPQAAEARRPPPAAARAPCRDPRRGSQGRAAPGRRPHPPPRAPANPGAGCAACQRRVSHGLHRAKRPPEPSDGGRHPTERRCEDRRVPILAPGFAPPKAPPSPLRRPRHRQNVSIGVLEADSTRTAHKTPLAAPFTLGMVAAAAVAPPRGWYSSPDVRKTPFTRDGGRWAAGAGGGAAGGGFRQPRTPTPRRRRVALAGGTSGSVARRRRRRARGSARIAAAASTGGHTGRAPHQSSRANSSPPGPAPQALRRGARRRRACCSGWPSSARSARRAPLKVRARASPRPTAGRGDPGAARCARDARG